MCKLSFTVAFLIASCFRTKAQPLSRKRKLDNASYDKANRPNQNHLYAEMHAEAKTRKPAVWTSVDWPDCNECEEYTASFEIEYVEGFASYYNYTNLCYRCAAAKILQMPHKYTPLNVWYH